MTPEALQRECDLLQAQINDARAILGAADDEMLSDAAARVMVDLGSEGVPVHHTYAGDSTEVVIRITSRDPALLSLPFGARLALVVTRG